MTEILNLSCQSVAPGTLQEKLRRQKLERKEICTLSPTELWVYDTSRFDPIISWYLLDEHGEIMESGDMMLGCIGSPYVFFYIKEELQKKNKFPVPVVFSNIQRTTCSPSISPEVAPATTIITTQDHTSQPAVPLPVATTDDESSDNIPSALQKQAHTTVTHHTGVLFPAEATLHNAEDYLYNTAIAYPHHYNNDYAVRPDNPLVSRSQPANYYLYAATGTSPPLAIPYH